MIFGRSHPEEVAGRLPAERLRAGKKVKTAFVYFSFLCYDGFRHFLNEQIK